MDGHRYSLRHPNPSQFPPPACKASHLGVLDDGKNGHKRRQAEGGHPQQWRLAPLLNNPLPCPLLQPQGRFPNLHLLLQPALGVLQSQGLRFMPTRSTMLQAQPLLRTHLIEEGEALGMKFTRGVLRT